MARGCDGTCLLWHGPQSRRVGPHTQVAHEWMYAQGQSTRTGADLVGNVHHAVQRGPRVLPPLPATEMGVPCGVALHVLPGTRHGIRSSGPSLPSRSPDTLDTPALPLPHQQASEFSSSRSFRRPRTHRSLPQPAHLLLCARPKSTLFVSSKGAAALLGLAIRGSLRHATQTWSQEGAPLFSGSEPK